MNTAEQTDMAGLDPLIHPPLRLRLCAMLAGVERMAFPVMRESLGVSNSVLSKHARALQEADYVHVVKEPQNHQGIRTWLQLTTTGRQALDGHLAALKAIAAVVERAPTGD